MPTPQSTSILTHIIHLVIRKQQPNNQAIDPQNFRKNQDQHHANKEPRLLRSPSNSSVTNHANCEPRAQTAEAHHEATGQVQRP